MTSIAGEATPGPDGPPQRVARIADVIARSAAANETAGQLVPQLVDGLHEQRLFRLLLPRAYGGEEIDPVTWFHTMEALAGLDASTAWCVGQINGCAMASSALEPDIARRIWGEPRAVLSWGPPLSSRAEEVDGGHRVSGEWQMSSGSRHATWLGLMAPVLDASGAPVALPTGVSTRIFLVPAESVEWVDNWNTIGLRATNSGGFKVHGRFVPRGYSLAREHLGEVRIATPLYQLPFNSLFGIGFSAVALGTARAMLDAVIALAREKQPRMARQSLRDNHQVQFQIGEAEARLRSARGYVEATADRVWRSVAASGELTIPQRLDIRLAATFAIHEANAVADAAWQVAGADAIFASGPFERRLRDIRTVQQQMQGRKAHVQDVGAFLLGGEPNLSHA